jgi:aminomethyltransferase
MRYTLFTDGNAGILDDLMVTNVGDYLFLVVNAARKAEDFKHLQDRLPAGARAEMLDDRSLLALQGPGAAAALARLAPGAAGMKFMTAAPFVIDGSKVAVSRSGYTGEDGFEISVPTVDVERMARLILAQPEVAPAGLGARDSLRLEAGLCLYGHDIDTTTTPVEAGLAWTIGKRRRADGGYPGADVIARQLAEGAPRRRVGIVPDGKAPAREGTTITDANGQVVGIVTSGGFGPTVDGPIAMGYVVAAAAVPGTALNLIVRGTPRPARVRPLPFVPHRYVKN